MKKLFPLLTLSLFVFTVAFTQSAKHFGGGPYPMNQPTECLSKEARNLIKAELSQNIQDLEREGQLPKLETRAVLKFGWPMSFDTLDGWNSYYGVSNYVDQDPSDQIRDFNCNSVSYDGHRGTDYFTFPFAWYL